MFRYTLFTLVAAASAAVVHEGACPSSLKPVENFNLTAYSGAWFEISKYPQEAEKKAKCASAEYKLEGDHIKVKNTHIVDGVQTHIEGTAKLAADANKAGKLALSLKFGDVVKESPLFVLATDYTHYAIAYSCRSSDKKSHEDFAWVLSRTKKLEGEAKTAVDNYLKAHAKELDATKFVQTDLSDEACKFNSTTVITEAPKA